GQLLDPARAQRLFLKRAIVTLALEGDRGTYTEKQVGAVAFGKRVQITEDVHGMTLSSLKSTLSIAQRCWISSMVCCTQFSACLWASTMERGSCPLGWMAGPICTCTVPERLPQPRRGQNSPALCATGTMGALLAQASAAPPRLNLIGSPGSTRSRSENTSTQWASRSRWRAIRLSCCRELRALLRLMAMGFIRAKAQPKKGTYSSSFLISWVWGANTSCRKKVSQVLWWLARITPGWSGMFSRPVTR